MARLLWLVDVLRSSGVIVHEYDGWRSRGRDSYDPRGIVIHETQGSLHSTDSGELHTLAISGSNSAPAPISQLYLSREGHWWVVGSGRCNHALTGWGGGMRGKGNSALLGIEAAHAQGETWVGDRLVQYQSYVRGVAGILRHTGWPLSAVVGHKEHQPGAKSDPGFNMDQFRRDLSAALERPDVVLGGGVTGEDDDVSAQDVWQFNLPKVATPADPRVKAPATDIVAGAAVATWTTLEEVRATRSAIDGLAAAAVAGEARDKLAMAAIDTLTQLIQAGGGEANTAQILARIDQRATEAGSQVATLQKEIAELRETLTKVEAERDRLQAQLDRG